MKKFIISLMAVILTLTITPIMSSATTVESPVTTKPNEKTAESAEARALVLRLNEIKSMDKSKLKANDKKALHKEVKTIKRKLKDISGGVYLSAGAIILILLLLIILT
jgi:hypothetical protein